MKNKKTKVVGGTGIGVTLFLIFSVLKLTNNIDWSWFYVSLPLWLGPTLLLLGIGIIFIIGVIGILIKHLIKNK